MCRIYLPHKIKDGEVFLYQRILIWSIVNPMDTLTHLEGIPTAVQFHGYHKAGDSFLVTQYRPSNLSEDQYFPKS